MVECLVLRAASCSGGAGLEGGGLVLGGLVLGEQRGLRG